MSEILEQISTAVIEGNLDDIEDLTDDALDEGLNAEEILDKGLMAGMDYVGVEFKKISWPDRQELVDSTVVVITFIVILAVVVLCCDKTIMFFLQLVHA